MHVVSENKINEQHLGPYVLQKSLEIKSELVTDMSDSITVLVTTHNMYCIENGVNIITG